MREWVFGRNPVYETLRANRRTAFQLLVVEKAKSKGRLASILSLAKEQRIPVKFVPRQHLDNRAPGNQGVLLEVSGYPYTTIHDIIEKSRQTNQEPIILILDTLQDPQNLGTLLRTAEAFGVAGILIPLRRSATVTPAVVNASSGASEHLMVAQANLAQSINTLKEEGFWVVGLEGSEEASLPGEINMEGRIALVVGNEASGLRPLVRKSCDNLLKIPMVGKVDSFNAAVAGSIALYIAAESRKTPGS